MSKAANLMARIGGICVGGILGGLGGGLLGYAFRPESEMTNQADWYNGLIDLGGALKSVWLGVFLGGSFGAFAGLMLAAVLARRNSKNQAPAIEKPSK